MSRLILCPRQNTEQGCTLTNCLFKHRTRVCIEFGKSQCFLGSTCNKFHVYSLRKDESKVLLVKAATMASPTKMAHASSSNTTTVKKRAQVVDDDALEQDGETEFKNAPLDRGSTSFFDWYPPVYDDQKQDAPAHEFGHGSGSGSGPRPLSAPSKPQYTTRMHAPVLARASASPQVGQSIAHVGQDTSATWAVPVFGMSGSIGINSSETGLILPNPDYGDQFPLNFGKPPIYEPEQVDLDSIVDAAPLTSLNGLGARTSVTNVSAATMYKTSTSRRRRKRGKRGKHSKNIKYGKTESKASLSRGHSDKTETDSDSDTDSDIEEGQVPFNPAVVKQCATFNCPNATARDLCSDCIGHSIRNNAGSYKAPELTGKAAHFMAKHGL